MYVEKNTDLYIYTALTRLVFFKHVHISVLKDIVLVTLLTYGPNVVSILFYCSSHVYYD